MSSMGDKRYWHHIWTLLRPIRSWYLVIALLVCFLIGLGSLRNNNLTALRLRDKVVEVDKQNGDIEAALRQLRTYVYSHMNTSLASGPNAIKPPVQLKYRYERLVAAEKQRVSEANQKVYTDAQSTCERLFPTGLSGGGRVPCIQDYVTKNGTSEQSIPDSLYKFDFASPVWSPDFAGWMLVFSALFSLLLVVRISVGYGLRRYLHERNN